MRTLDESWPPAIWRAANDNRFSGSRLRPMRLRLRAPTRNTTSANAGKNTRRKSELERSAYDTDWLATILNPGWANAPSINSCHMAAKCGPPSESKDIADSSVRCSGDPRLAIDSGAMSRVQNSASPAVVNTQKSVLYGRFSRGPQTSVSSSTKASQKSLATCRTSAREDLRGPNSCTNRAFRFDSGASVRLTLTSGGSASP